MNRKNIFGEPLITCSDKPKTGFFRDGCCNTDPTDVGEHTICIIASIDFLDFSRRMGNDLSTPNPKLLFDGVKPGDKWCLCAFRWIEALKNHCAPKIVLEATNETVLKHISIDILLEFAYYKK